MKLSPLTLKRLKSRIIGDEGPFPRLPGPEILELFNKIGFKDIYDWKNGGMPGTLSRKEYAFEKMKEVNGTINLQKLIELIASKAHFLGSGQNNEEAIKAQYNEETVTVTTSVEFATEFAETFMKLKKADSQV